MNLRVLNGDALAVLRALPSESVQCCVTSPPYFGLRDYGVDGQIGLEESPEAYISNLVAVFREVRRVLADDGTLWLNMGDSYAGPKPAGGADKAGFNERYFGRPSGTDKQADTAATKPAFRTPDGYKPKDPLGIPWMLAFALRADGWFLRSAIVWHKPNPMPESVRDRPTSAYEHVFLLTNNARYFYDAEAISEPFADERMGASGAKALPYSAGSGRRDTLAQDGRAGLGASPSVNYRNARNVWTIATKPYSGAHFATMPPNLAERCIKAGSRPGDTVLDPFGGAGTTALAAKNLGRSAVIIELNRAYCRLARRRLGISTILDHFAFAVDARQRSTRALEGFT